MLNPNQLKLARIKRKEEIKAGKYSFEIIVNIGFMCVLFILAYSISGNSAFNYKNSIANFLNPQNPGLDNSIKVNFDYVI
jgi:hypothetical protein